MSYKSVNFSIIFLFLLIFSFELKAEFKKEIELTDAGKCEEALRENNNTSIEQEEKFNPKKPFVGKNTIKIFRIYALNRKAIILKVNCKRTAEAFEVAKKSLELEKEIYKIPSTKFDKVLQYNEFKRKINLAGSYSTIAGFYIDFGDLKNGIKNYKKSIEIYESTDLYKKDNLLNYGYSILAGVYNRYGDLRNANIYKNKHLDYMGRRYGNKTVKYFKALFDVYYQYSDQGYYDFALDTLLEIKKTININIYYADDSMGELKLNHQLATAYYRNNDYDNSINIHKKNLNFIKTKQLLPNQTTIANKLFKWEILILNDMALNTQYKFDLTGDFKYLDEAEQAYLRILRISKDSNLDEVNRDNYITKDNLSGIYISKNEFGKALPLVEENYADCIKVKNKNDPSCLTQMITYANVVSRFDLKKAINILENFLKLEPKTNRSFIRQRVNARGSLSILYADIGNNKRSEELIIESVNLIDPTDTRFRDVYVLTMNNYYLQIGKNGQYENAINGYLELIQFVDKNFGVNSTLKQELLNNLGFSYSALKDNSNALKYYLESEKLSVKFKQNRNLAITRMNIGDIHFWSGDNKKANSYYKLALEIIEYSSLQTKIFLYAGLCKTEAIMGNYDQAIIYGNQGLESAKKLHGINHPSNLTLLDSLALANSYKKNYNNKFKNLTDIYNIINDYSKGYLTENFNADPNEYFQQIYSFLYTAAERNDNEDEHKKFKIYFEENTFDTIDNAVFNLTEILRTTKVTVNTNKMLQRNFFDDENKQSKLRLLESKIENYSKIPKYASNQKEKKEIAIKIEKSKKEIEDLKKELDLGKLLKGDSFVYQNINISDVQKSLKNDEAILYYVSYPNNLYFGVIGKDYSKFLYKYYSEDKISDLVKNIRKSINYDNGVLSKFDYQSSKELYGELIEPFKNYIKDEDQLIIVPNGSLLSMPFEILLDEIPQDNSFNNNNWLIKKHNIIYYPSISSFHAMKSLDKIELKGYFAGFGDPKLSQVNKKIVSTEKIDVNKIFLRGGIADVNKIRQFAELPKTADELKTISKYFNKTDIYLKNDFNEENIKSLNLDKYSVLSFATHGIVANELNGVNEPGLITTPPTVGTIDNDGVLSSSEIKNLKLNAELVILSACNTAAGDGSSAAEGLSGLTSSFFYAGARSLLVSHWYVEDESTVNLMKSTFGNLDNSLNLSQSLRLTKINMLNDESTSHPIFWAPFILIGGSN